MTYYAQQRTRRLSRHLFGEPVESVSVKMSGSNVPAQKHDSLTSSMLACDKPFSRNMPELRASEAVNASEMSAAKSCCEADGTVLTAEWLLDRIKEVRGYLRRKGFSLHAVEEAVTTVYRVGLPHVSGATICAIKNHRAWLFMVARNAATRAAKCEVGRSASDPSFLSAPVERFCSDEELFDIHEALKQLTDRQSAAVELCLIGEIPQRAAAQQMGIAVGTLGSHLRAAKVGLKKILTNMIADKLSKHCDPGAFGSYAVKIGKPRQPVT